MEAPNGRSEPGFGADLNHPPQPASPPSDTPSGTQVGAGRGTSGAHGIQVPEAISFRQLSVLRQGAIEAGRSEDPTERSGPDAARTPGQGSSPGQVHPQPGQAQAAGAELVDLEQLLEAYEQLGQRLLHQLSRQGSALEQHRHPQQVMALGALGAHIRLGLQALAASRQ